MCPTSQLTFALFYWKKEKKKKQTWFDITTNNRHKSTFQSFDLFSFTEGDGTIIPNEGKKEKILKLTQFCNFQRALGKISVFRNCGSGHLRLETF